jgi:hypothetical protein
MDVLVALTKLLGQITFAESPRPWIIRELGSLVAKARLPLVKETNDCLCSIWQINVQTGVKIVK